MAVLAVGLGGFIGACLRYGLAQLFVKQAGAFPVGTLLANVIAGLLIGFIIGLDRGAGLFSPNARLFLTTGCMGGLSTFSAFSLETVDLFMGKRYGAALGYVLLSLGLCFAGVAAGMALAGLVVKRS